MQWQSRNSLRHTPPGRINPCPHASAQEDLERRGPRPAPLRTRTTAAEGHSRTRRPASGRPAPRDWVLSRAKPSRELRKTPHRAPGRARRCGVPPCFLAAGRSTPQSALACRSRKLGEHGVAQGRGRAAAGLAVRSGPPQRPGAGPLHATECACVPAALPRHPTGSPPCSAQNEAHHVPRGPHRRPRGWRCKTAPPFTAALEGHHSGPLATPPREAAPTAAGLAIRGTAGTGR